MRFRITFYLAHPNGKTTEEGYQMCDTKTEAESYEESWQAHKDDGFCTIEEVLG